MSNPLPTRTSSDPNSSADVNALSSAIGQLTGIKEFPAGSFDYPVANPAPLDTDIINGDKVLRHLFDDTTEESVLNTFIVPDRAENADTITFNIFGYASTWVTGKNVEFKFYHQPAADDEDLSAAFSNIESGDLALNTTGQDYQDILTFSETLSNLGWTAGDKIRFKLSRIQASANDLSGDYGLTLFEIKF
jgi:hypothetical protein